MDDIFEGVWLLLEALIPSPGPDEPAHRRSLRRTSKELSDQGDADGWINRWTRREGLITEGDLRMSEAATARAIVRAAVYGPAWHGPSVSEALQDVDAARAAARAIADAHSIWELLLHMNAWQKFVLACAEGSEPTMLENEANFPPVTDSSDAAWEAAINDFFETADQLDERCAALTESDLARPVTQHQFPFKIMLHGIAHHNIYHAGQIALLKK